MRRTPDYKSTSKQAKIRKWLKWLKRSMQQRGNCEVISRADRIKIKRGNDRGDRIAYGEIDGKAWKRTTKL